MEAEPEEEGGGKGETTGPFFLLIFAYPLH